ncbi:MAG: hypothetical protein AB7H88_12140 [Vicinamibacterales bacterium]
MAHALVLKLRAFERDLERDLRRRQRQFRQGVPAYLRDASLRNLLTTPIIYSMAVPFVLLDAWVTLFQWICFPLYGITRVRRRDYVIIDRHRLGHLNAIEKVNCAYCGYANGVLAYVTEVTGRTEQYWCPIRHRRAVLRPHAHYRRFVPYDDAAAYRRELPRLRALLAREAAVAPGAGARRRRGRARSAAGPTGASPRPGGPR